MVHQVMLAHAENAILPALLLLAGLFLVLYPVAIWVLLSSRSGKHTRLTISCAAVIAIVGGAGALGTMKSSQWPPEWGDLVGFVLWLFPVFCGLVAVARTMRRKGEGKS